MRAQCGAARARALTRARLPLQWANDRTPMRWRDIATACVLVPPRVAACLSLAAVVLPISMGLLFLASLLPARLRQAPRLRACLLLPVRFLCRLALLGAGFWWVTTSGSFEPRRGANIIVANHACVGDVLFSLWYIAPAFLSKAEALHIPYVGAVTRALGCVLVDRGSAASRAAARDAISQRAAARSEDAPPLMIFPEGTTTNGLSVIAWERGAFAPGQPVIPVGIAYPKGQPKPDALFSLETLRAIARPRNRMHVTFLPPYAPDAAECAAAAAFAAGVRAAVAAALDLPCSERTYREGLHRNRRETSAHAPCLDAAAAAAAAAQHNALPPLPFRAGGGAAVTLHTTVKMA